MEEKRKEISSEDHRENRLALIEVCKEQLRDQAEQQRSFVNTGIRVTVYVIAVIGLTASMLDLGFSDTTTRILLAALVVAAVVVIHLLHEVAYPQEWNPGPDLPAADDLRSHCTREEFFEMLLEAYLKAVLSNWDVLDEIKTCWLKRLLWAALVLTYIAAVLSLYVIFTS